MDTMLSKALREFTAGPLNQLIVNLGGCEGSQWEEELKRFLRKEPCWAGGDVALKPKPKPKPLLDFLGEVSIPAIANKFVAKDRFVVNTKSNAPVKISYVGDNFTAWFLSDDGKIEDQITEQTLRYGKLCKESADAPIIAELGGEEKSETTRTEMYSLMEKQKNGEDGVLLNNGYANIFYIRDAGGVLRAVDVGWRDGGWRVRAYPVEDPRRWSDGDQVFSRK
jgi:hypothetical protein